MQKWITQTAGSYSSVDFPESKFQCIDDIGYETNVSCPYTSVATSYNPKLTDGTQISGCTLLFFLWRAGLSRFSYLRLSKSGFSSSLPPARAPKHESYLFWGSPRLWRFHLISKLTEDEEWGCFRSGLSSNAWSRKSTSHFRTLLRPVAEKNTFRNRVWTGLSIFVMTHR